MTTLFQGTYDAFNLSAALKTGLADLGYTHPTFVQNEVFSPIRSGGDFVVQSHTGSGKTTAFCLPILQKVEEDQAQEPQVLMLAPTRELAKQVATECTRLGHHAGIKVSAIYGGASFDTQIAALKAGAQIIVGTPGRLKDLVSRGQLKLSTVHTVVLDEADEMLSMGFWEDVTFLLNQTPKERQTLLFSATLPWVIEQSLGQIARSPKTINLSSDQVGAKSIRHVVHHEDDSQTKPRQLLYALELHKPARAIVFCNLKEETETLENYLTRFSFKAKALNGDMSQSAREKVMHDIKNHAIDIVIATDVAARGIDIPGLTHVFNYELPHDPEVYVHRTGRTGRIGHLGTAISLIRGADVIMLDTVQKTYEISFDTVKLPEESEILWMQAERLAALLTEQADGVEISQYRQVASSMLKRDDASEIFAFLLRSYFAKKPSSTPAPERTYKQEHRQNREPRPPRQPREVKESPFKELYVTLGRSDGFQDLTSLAQHVSDITHVDVGHFTGGGNLRDTSSHIEVDAEVASKIREALHGQPRSSGVTETITCDFGTGKPIRKRFHPVGKRRSQNSRPN